MRLEGSCHCGAVMFSVESKTPYPYNWCFCTICRKTAGGGGYAINLGGDATTMEVTGEEHITVYRASNNDRDAYEADGLGFSRRHFCSKCGSALWVFNPKWPDLIHPFASAIDTPLPSPPEVQAIMTAHAASWARLPDGAAFEHYPDQGIVDWHKARDLLDD